jgi:hypothetical protein
VADEGERIEILPDRTGNTLEAQPREHPGTRASR